MPDLQDRNISASFAKGLAVLACFDGTTRTLTLAEIARRTGQDRATARRGALTLVAQGYLQQDGRAFALTARVLGFAGGFLQANRIGQLVQPVLNHHARQLGHDITLATLDGDKVLLVAQSTLGDGPVSYGFTVGSHLPLLHTSLGRMLLASLAPEEAERLVNQAPLPRHTPQSLGERGHILEQVQEAAKSGISVTSGEFEPGIAGIAVPLSSRAGQPMVLGSSFPASVLTDAENPVADQLNLAAAALRGSVFT